jgi:glucokinase
MEKRILAADIGGTSSRFASFRTAADGPAGIEAVWEVPSNEFDSLGDLLQAVEGENSGLSLQSTDAVVLAVPGPVEDEKRARLANVKWPVDLSLVEDRYGRRPFFLINDFEAQAYGCLTRAVAGTRCIKDGRRQTDGTLAVVGAGTGLGHCSLKPDGRGGLVAFPSEAAHAVFPFSGDREQAYRRFLTEAVGVAEPTGDLVVSGRGLALLHRHLTGDDLPPDQVAGRISPKSDTTRWFSRFYARAARHYALSVLPTAGLFISGGVAVKNPFLVDNDTWRAEFVNSDAKKQLLAAIRVDLVTEEGIGLWGAARYGFERLSR